ncbi:hypothetical protein JHK86_018401 [Glycine max]|nr:hypothetical protein JHK86_018401 [Glycine max]
MVEVITLKLSQKTIEDSKFNLEYSLPQVGAKQYYWDSNLADCGGLIGYHNGKYVLGFMVKLGTCSVSRAQLWAIFQGLKLALDRELTNILIESDSTEAEAEAVQ